MKILIYTIIIYKKMFKIRNSQKQPDFFAPLLQPNGGFKTDENSITEIFDCRPKELDKFNATGRITIKDNLIYQPSRPSIYGKYRKENYGNLTQKPIPVMRNSFLPTRKSTNLPNNDVNRTTEEERKALRMEDIERNGALVQVSNKTLDRVFEKFDLFTISDEIIDLQKKGKMSQKDVRASALLKLTKEVKHALKTSNIEEAKEALEKIKKEKETLVPDLSDLGESPQDVAQNPSLLLALFNEVMDNPDTDEDTVLIIRDMIADGEIYINPENGMINDLIKLKAITSLDIEQIRDGISNIKDDEIKSIFEKLLKYVDKKEQEVDSNLETDETITETRKEVDDIVTQREKIDVELDNANNNDEVPGFINRFNEKMDQPVEDLGDLSDDEEVIQVGEPVYDDEIYDIVEYGSEEKTKQKIKEFINKTHNEVMRILAQLPKQLDPSFEDKIKMNKKRMFDIGKELFTIKNFESDEIKEYTQQLINQLNKEKSELISYTNSIEAPKDQELLDDEPLIEEIQEEVKEENNPFSDIETLTQVLNNENRVNELKKLARAYNQYVASLPKFKVNTNQINNVKSTTIDNLKQLILDKYRQFIASQTQPRRRMLSFNKALEDKLRECALKNTRNVPQKAIINKYQIPQLNDRNIVNVVADICREAGLGDEATQRTFNCASRALVKRLLDDGIINYPKAKELRDRLDRIQKKGKAKDKVDNYKRVFGELASEGDIKKGGPSVRPQPRAEPQPGDASRPMTISDLPEAKTIEQIQRMK